MDREVVREKINQGRIRWQRHALQRMMERGITRNEVKKTLLKGELIEEYPKDHPYPSGLFFYIDSGLPLHVVAAIDKDAEWCYIITAYRPDSEHFESDYKTRTS